MRIAGITLFPFIILRKKYKNVERWMEGRKENLIQHETIHIKQQIEMLIIPFYIWYFIEWIIKFIKYRDAKKAYKSISFEKEANIYENRKNYLEFRKPYSWIKFL
jgi:hypothetical protein